MIDSTILIPLPGSVGYTNFMMSSLATIAKETLLQDGRLTGTRLLQLIVPTGPPSALLIKQEDSCGCFFSEPRSFNLTHGLTLPSLAIVGVLATFSGSPIGGYVIISV